MCGYVCVGVYGLILRTPKILRARRAATPITPKRKRAYRNLSSPSLRSVSLWFSPDCYFKTACGCGL